MGFSPNAQIVYGIIVHDSEGSYPEWMQPLYDENEDFDIIEDIDFGNNIEYTFAGSDAYTQYVLYYDRYLVNTDWYAEEIDISKFLCEEEKIIAKEAFIEFFLKFGLTEFPKPKYILVPSYM